MLTTLEAIDARCSASQLTTPGPTATELRQMFRAAASAPDHGRCRSWRFINVPSQTADDFGAVLETAYLRRCAAAGEPADPRRQERERNRLRRAPTLVVVACCPCADSPIPVHEQQAAVAAATQNLLLAATAMGFGSKWSTGQAATDLHVKEALNLGAEDSIVAFVYLGTVPEQRVGRSPRRVIDLAGVVRTWQPSALSLVD